MAKRGYKLQEFVAHSENVNCLSLGKKSRRLLVTGGDDNKVNLWAIGKPASLMSLCGHTSSVESVAFDSEEVLVLAGSSSGVIKLWDLEESKLVRGLTGHRSNCTAVEFHPFGEFFASGSMNTNLKVWDIRKKGCIHTFKGHTRGISTIRFSPDGRWVVSGGFDNVVKVWDLTAGKLLHDLKFHEGHIRSIDFHPLEFLLATGSADRTVKFWDLETFELIGSTRPEATGVRNIAFHPDGKTLFCGSDDAFKVYSWEPVVCHDSVDIEWSTLGDLCIHEGKLLGCSYYQNSVGVWVADISHVKPYGGHTDPEQNNCIERKSDLKSYSLEKAGSHLGISPDDEPKDIKNIYVDTAAGNPVASQRVGSLNLPKSVPPLDSYEISKFLAEKQSRAVDIGLKSNGQAVNRSIIEPKDTCSEDSLKSGRESVTFSKTKPGMLLRPAHARKPSNSKCEVDKLLAASGSGNLSTTKSKLDNGSHLNSEAKIITEDRGIKSCEDECSDIKDDAEKFDKTASERTTHNTETSKDFPDLNKDSSSVKIVKGVAVVPGRTRTLVERFEKREKLNSNETETTDITPHMISETDRTVTVMQAEPQTQSEGASASDQNITESCLSREESTSLGDRTILEDHITRTETSLASDTKATPSVEEPSTPGNQNTISSQLFQRDSSSTGDKASLGRQSSRKESTLTNDRKVITIGNQSSRRESTSSRDEIMSRSQISRRGTGFAYDRKDAATSIQISRRESTSSGNGNIFARSTLINDRKVTVAERQSSRRESTSAGYEIRSGSQINKLRPNFANDTEISAYEIPVSRRELISPGDETVLANRVAKMGLAFPTDRKVLTTESQISKRETISYTDGDVQKESLSSSANDRDITEKLMETHDVFLSTLRSRLTKLQVVSHFWEWNDTKGAISALQKLPDHSVQVDVLSALMERKESFTLDLFSCLLPVLMSMLNSQMERHVSVSLEMLLKLVAVFGPGINSTLSAPRSVGVDLHAEQRREWCNQCFVQLQKVQKLLPAIIRRGGSLARSAEELNLVLQQS